MQRPALVLVFVSFLALARAPVAPAAEPLAGLVPPGTLGLVVLPDLGKSREAFRATGLGRLLEEPEVQAFFKALAGPFEEQIEGGVKEATGASLSEILALLKGEVGFALAGVDRERDLPRFLFSLQYGANEKTVQTLLARVLRTVGEDKKTETREGVTIVTRVRGRPVTLAYSLLDGKLLVSLHEELVKGARDLHHHHAHPGARPSLANAPAYQAARRRAGQDGTESFFVFVHAAEIWKQFRAEMPERARTALEALGLFDWQSLAWSSRFEGQRMVDLVHLGTSGAEKKGLLKVLLPRGLDQAGLPAAPAGAIASGMGAFDLAASWEEALRITGAIDQKSHQEVTQAIQGFEKRAGFQVATFLASLGTRWAAWGRMPGRGLAAQSMWAIEVKDAEAFLAGFRALARGLSLELVTAEYKGRTLHHLRSPLGELGKNPFEGEGIAKSLGALVAVFLAPHFYVENGWARFSDLHQSLLDHLDQAPAGERLMLHLAAGTVATGSSSGGRAVAGVYNTLLPLAGALEGLLRTLGVPYDSRLLPRGSTLQKHLGSAAYWRLESAREGVTFMSSGNIAIGPGAVAVTGMGAAMLLPVLARVREKANQANCRNNLKQLGLSLILYRENQGKGKYPPLERFLTALYTSGASTEEDQFCCPTAGTVPDKKGLESHQKTATSYDWTPFPIFSERLASETPIVWDREAIHSGVRAGASRNVLFLDGHVESLPEARFQQALADAKARWEKHVKEHGPTRGMHNEIKKD